MYDRTTKAAGRTEAGAATWRRTAFAVGGFSCLHSVAIVFFHRDWLFDLPGADPLAYALCPNGCLRLAAAADREQRVRDRGVAGEETPLRRGQLFKADTLEALAVQIGVDLATFTAEMKRYNSFCEAGRTRISDATCSTI